MEAKNAPRQYNRKEVHTGDMPIDQKHDVDLGLESPIIHGDDIAAIEVRKNQKYLGDLSFMEEPMTIRIEENTHSDLPETHVPCQVNGKSAEVLINGKWTEIGWLPIGVVMITKRKYVEVLARSRSDNIKTVHDEATVERPRNTQKTRTSSNYPLAIIEDKNPRGSEWLSAIIQGR